MNRRPWFTLSAATLAAGRVAPAGDSLRAATMVESPRRKLQ
jgi:hypothetical protein